jgi:hypothetical protein
LLAVTTGATGLSKVELVPAEWLALAAAEFDFEFLVGSLLVFDVLG